MVWYNPFTWAAVHWTAVAPWVAIAVAIIAALFLRVQVNEARRLRLEQARPFVVVDCELHASAHGVVVLVIENFGTTAAYGVKLRFSPELQVTMGQKVVKLTESTLIRQGIPTLAPHKRITTILDIMPHRVAEQLPMVYTVTVSYEDSERMAHADTYTLDLELLRGISYIGRKDIHHVAEHLKDVREELKKVNRELLRSRHDERQRPSSEFD